MSPPLRNQSQTISTKGEMYGNRTWCFRLRVCRRRGLDACDANRSAAQELAVLRAAQEEREKAFQQQIEGLKEAKESLSAQFHEIGGKLLGDARKAFLEQAGERFTQAVTPVEMLLKTYQEKLQTIEKERVDHYAGLREAADLVRTGQGQVRDETRNLVNALRASPKARG